MGKWGKYSKHFNNEWKKLPEFKGWLEVSKNGDTMAFCTHCKVELRSHKTDLLRHSKTRRHTTNACKLNPGINQQSTLDRTVSVYSNESKKTEIILACYVACHGSIKSIDHLSNLLKRLIGKNITDCKLEDIRLHRTKCTMIIKNVIAVNMKKDVVRDLGNNYFSLMIDESTDVSISKYLCLCIKYFSVSKNRIITTYLGIIEIVSATATALHESIISFLKEAGINIKNMIGLGTDGANNLCGKNHSVFSLLKEEIPKLILVKCAAHSLHLCASKASQVLPTALDFLCTEIYNWFSHSVIRRDSYKQIFNLININENNKFRRHVQLSQTRWLARVNAIKILLEQWIELREHFSMIVANERSYMARVLCEMIKDNSNYLYLTVVYTVLSNVTNLNILFQVENVDLFRLHVELYDLLLRSLRFIIKPAFLHNVLEMSFTSVSNILNILNNELAFISIDTIDFGYKFREALKEFGVCKEKLYEIKVKCRDFIKELCVELCNRLPQNIKIFDCIKCFSPENCLKLINRPSFNALPLELCNNSNDLFKIEQQWNNLININWCNDNTINSEKFWIIVYNYTNAGGMHIFKELAEFALMVLSLPVSNASVERIFSTMNIVKNRLRNKINFSTLDSILLIRHHFFTNNLCCSTFSPTKEMLEAFNVNMYKINKQCDTVEDADEDDFELYDVLDDAI